MQRISLVLVCLLFATLACNFGAAPTPVPPATEPPPGPEIEPSPTLPATLEAPTAVSGLERTCQNVRLIIPQGLATEIECRQAPPLSGEEVAPWEATPGHLEIDLVGYSLADKFHSPRLYVFPAVDLVAVQPAAAESIGRLQAILANPGVQPTSEQLPGVHFFNAAGVFKSNIALTNFQNGAGLRSLSVYAQYSAPANNYDLFYHFQGLTANGQYYLIAILPITHPGLQADPERDSLPPAGDFPVFPGFSATEAEITSYYLTVANLLDAAAPDSFSPSLADLDALIASIVITP
ncbi:MAG: hypothetical protein RBS68_15920 [Anaerolineales bacterium]|jgi:hypothetical protein|nr:hypothetical protein [Anaerolineales bacterium]